MCAAGELSKISATNPTNENTSVNTAKHESPSAEGRGSARGSDKIFIGIEWEGDGVIQRYSAEKSGQGETRRKVEADSETVFMHAESSHARMPSLIFLRGKSLTTHSPLCSKVQSETPLIQLPGTLQTKLESSHMKLALSLDITLVML